MLRRSVFIGVTISSVLVATAAGQVIGGTPQARAEGLVAYPDCSAFLAQMRSELRAAATSYGAPGSGWGRYASGSAVDMAAESAVVAATQSLSAKSAASDVAAGSGATGTNLQEAGVDEPDVAKLADGRIVSVDEQVLRVRSAGPKPQSLGTLKLGSPKFGLNQMPELLIAGQRAVVVQSGADFVDVDGAGGPAGSPKKPLRSDSTYVAPEQSKPVTKVALVDLSGGKPVLLETATYDGTYVSARLVGGTLRLVTSFRVDLPGVMAATDAPTSLAQALEANRKIAAAAELEDVLPYVVQEAGGKERRTAAVDCTQVSHPQEGNSAGMLVVSTLRPDEGLDQLDRDGVVTGGDLVYASEDRLYVATTGRVGSPVPLGIAAVPNAAAEGGTDELAAPKEPSTKVHAFDTTDETSTRYLASGSVTGQVLGRWAFSEHEGILRVATTRNPFNDGVIFDDEGGAAGPSTVKPTVSSSMVVKLREEGGELVEVGRIAGLGKTEEIKSVRYMGDLAAVVTFRETDPLYLIDLSDKPRVLGELKVPGFSTYLHPIGNGLLLAVGMDGGANGRREMQASVFDVKNPSRPHLVDRQEIGYGDSPALSDSRAFTYDPERRVLLLPYTDWNGGSSEVQAIRVSADGKLARAATIAVSDERQLGRFESVERVLMDGQNFYAVQSARIVGGDLDTLRRTN